MKYIVATFPGNVFEFMGNYLEVHQWLDKHSDKEYSVYRVNVGYINNSQVVLDITYSPYMKEG